MLFADGFWEIRNLNDTIAVVGLSLTLISIWLSWWWAKRDLSKRIADAQRSARRAVERVASALSHDDLSEAIRFVRETIDAYRTQRWDRAIDRCGEVRLRIARLIPNPGLTEKEQELLGKAEDTLRLVQAAVEKLSRKPAKEQVPNQTHVERLLQLITLLGQCEGRLKTALLELQDD